MINKLLCRLNIHEVPQYRHPATKIWIWGSAVWVKTKTPKPYCIHEVDAYETTYTEASEFKFWRDLTKKAKGK